METGFSGQCLETETFLGIASLVFSDCETPQLLSLHPRGRIGNSSFQLAQKLH